MTFIGGLNQFYAIANLTFSTFFGKEKERKNAFNLSNQHKNVPFNIE